MDSPLFQLLTDYPGIAFPREVAEVFRARALMVSALMTRAVEAVSQEADVNEAKSVLGEIERQAHALAEPEEQLLITIMFAYRSIEAWGEMIRIAESMPASVSQVVTVREQWALALNRRNDPGDRKRAIEILDEIVEDCGESPETLGIQGRCYKDRWREKLEAGDPGAADALDLAIDAYERGFNADPRDFYPGINLLTLLVQRGRKEDLAEFARLAPVVAFAVARIGGIASGDYWTIATVLELAVAQGDESLARRAFSAMQDTAPDPWMMMTTAENIKLLSTALPGLGESDWVQELLGPLSKGNARIRHSRKPTGD